MINITLKQGDIIEEHVDAIVNPANSYGLMSGGVSKTLKNVGGAIIEAEAVKEAPIMIGNAVITTGGMLKARYVIHSPTMMLPKGKSTDFDIKNAVHAALRVADENNLSRIAMPGMGTGIGEFEPIDAAKIILDEIKKFKAKHLKEVILVDISEIMVKAFKDAVDEK